MHRVLATMGTHLELKGHSGSSCGTQQGWLSRQSHLKGAELSVASAEGDSQPTAASQGGNPENKYPTSLSSPVSGSDPNRKPESLEAVLQSRP